MLWVVFWIFFLAEAMKSLSQGKKIEIFYLSSV